MGEITTNMEDDITNAETAALRPGSIIADKYVVGCFLGAGGMAQVFEAVNRDLDERVALKVMHPSFMADPSLAAKLRAEARAAARIRSENVARVFDVVSTEQGDPVIVMELLEGQDLRSWAEARSPLPVEVAVGVIVEACSGLAVAHANGIVHRDVKPENLFMAHEIGGGTVVKLLDFGISRAALGHNPVQPGSGQHAIHRLLGTPNYMAPEQINSSRAADCRIDVWGIGVLMFELLADITPFESDTPEATCLAVLNGRRRDLRALRPNVPEELVEIIERCLHVKPQARYPSVADVAVALQPFARPHDHISVSRTVRLLRSAGLTEVVDLGSSGEVPRASQPSSEVRSSPLPPPTSPPSPPPAPVQETLPSAGSELRATDPSAAFLPVVEPLKPRAEANKRGLRAFIIPGLVALLFGALAGGIYVSLRRAPEPTIALSSPPARRQLQIRSIPEGATIEVGGRSIGVTPNRAELTEGRHQITLSLDGYRRETRVVEVSPGIEPEPLDLKLEQLEPVPTTLAQVSSPRPSESAPDSSEEEPPMAAKTSAGPRRGLHPVSTSPSSAMSTTSATPAPTVKVITDQPSNVKVIQ